MDHPHPPEKIRYACKTPPLPKPDRPKSRAKNIGHYSSRQCPADRALPRRALIGRALMTAAELKAWREREGLTLDDASERLDVGRRSYIRYENGERPIPASLVAQLVDLVVLPAPEALPSLSPSTTAVVVAFDPVKAGLERLPTSNAIYHADAAFDTREPDKGWKRIPGAVRVVRDTIPDPIPYAAPAWAGWRGVITASGRVFDYETGAELKPWQGAPSPTRPKPGDRARPDKKYGAAK